MTSGLIPLELPEPAVIAASVVIVLPLIITCEWVLLIRLLQNAGFTCPYCRKHILALSSWTCGHCHHTMRLSRWIWTFFRSCNACGNVPQYVKCPHCDVPVALVDNPDPSFMTVCARYAEDTSLLAYPPEEADRMAVSVLDGLEKKSGPPLVVAWRRAREDTLAISWIRVGHAGFRVRGCRYPKIPTSADEPGGQPVMAPASTVTDRLDVGVSPGRHGNFGFWLERDGFHAAGFVGFGVPPGAAVEGPQEPSPHEARRTMTQSILAAIHDVHRDWNEELDALSGEVLRGEITSEEHDRMKEAADQLYENQINELTGPQRL